jgi:nucleoside-diphosphate-sugar epimerase
MRIFLAGASGAVGKRLVPALVTKGHQVVWNGSLSPKSGLGEIDGRRTNSCERT